MLKKIPYLEVREEITERLNGGGIEERVNNFMIRIEHFSAVQFTLVLKLFTIIGLNRNYSTPVFCLLPIFGVFVIFWV